MRKIADVPGIHNRLHYAAHGIIQKQQDRRGINPHEPEQACEQKPMADIQVRVAAEMKRNQRANADNAEAGEEQGRRGLRHLQPFETCARPAENPQHADGHAQVPDQAAHGHRA